MTKVFVSDHDRRSFLTPAYSFSARRTAETHAAEHGLDARDSDAFKLFSVDDATYQPRSFTELDTGLLTPDRSSFRDEGRSQFMTLRRKATTSMPSGAGNTCLLVEGPREFYRYIHQTRKHPPYYYQFASTDFPCYAVWGRDGAHSLGNPLFEEDGRRVFVGRSGRGAIYGRAPRFNDDLTIAGYDTHVALVEFSLLDRDPSKDDVIRYTVHAMRSHGYEADETPKPYGLDSKRFDSLWRELEQRAFDGFLKTGALVSQASETELARFVDQMKKAEADRRAPYGTSYRERVKKMDWEAALRSVEEPWQLEVVVQEFNHDPLFQEHPSYDGARYNRVRNMLNRHGCDDGRRAKLNHMIESFVAPRDNLWNYTGD